MPETALLIASHRSFSNENSISYQLFFMIIMVSVPTISGLEPTPSGSEVDGLSTRPQSYSDCGLVDSPMDLLTTVDFLSGLHFFRFPH